MKNPEMHLRAPNGQIDVTRDSAGHFRLTGTLTFRGEESVTPGWYKGYLAIAVLPVGPPALAALERLDVPVDGGYWPAVSRNLELAMRSAPDRSSNMELAMFLSLVSADDVGITCEVAAVSAYPLWGDLARKHTETFTFTLRGGFLGEFRPVVPEQESAAEAPAMGG